VQSASGLQLDWGSIPGLSLNRGVMSQPADHGASIPSPEERRAVLTALVMQGVEIVDPDRTYVDAGVQVAAGAILYPGVHLRGSTTIGSGSCIGPDCWIEDTVVEASCVVRYAFLEGARVRERTTVGPYAHLRPGSDVGPDARIGNFVEVKNSRLQKGVKAGHLAYLGDADIHEDVNIGAGTVTCNYDGVEKHRTTIQPGVFIGTNSAIVAPVTIGEGAYVAAGSTITEDVPAKAKAFGRARQVNKLPRQDHEEDGG